MRSARCLLLLAFLAASSCNSDDGPVGPFLPMGEAGAPATTDVCEEGCALTLGAECERGPDDRATCEADCRALVAGACGAQYSELQACARGEEVTCSAEGYPVVEACAEQQAEFVACEND